MTIKYKKRALFLDRDGVINIDYGYVFEKDKFHFVDGIFDFIKEFQNRDFPIFIITNQSGIARGYYGENEFLEISKYMLKKFQENGIEITKIYHCPCHQDYSKICECRKPKPTMLLKAESEFNIDLKNSIFIGDNLTDIEAGNRAGIKFNYLFNLENMNFDNILNNYLEKVTK